MFKKETFFSKGYRQWLKQEKKIYQNEHLLLDDWHRPEIQRPKPLHYERFNPFVDILYSMPSLEDYEDIDQLFKDWENPKYRVIEHRHPLKSASFAAWDLKRRLREDWLFRKRVYEED